MARFPAERMRTASDVLGYEYGTFQDAAFIAMAAGAAGRLAVRNVALESAVVHMRILVDFFYNEDPKQTSPYVLAEHFFEDPAGWRSHRSRSDQLEWNEPSEPRRTITINQLADLCNNAAAHLTWKRLDSSRPRWRWRTLLLHFDGLLRTFIKVAPGPLITFSKDGQLAIPPTPAGIVTFVARYRTARYAPQVIMVPTTTGG